MMTDESSIKTTVKALMPRPLKSVSIDQIEEAIATALHKLTGQAYDVDVNRLDLNPEAAAWSRDLALLEIKVAKQVTMDRDNPLGKR